MRYVSIGYFLHLASYQHMLLPEIRMVVLQHCVEHAWHVVEKDKRVANPRKLQREIQVLPKSLST